MSLNFGTIRQWAAELASLEHLENFYRLIIGKNLVSTLVPSFLIGFSSFLQVTRTTIKARMSLNFDGLSPLTAEYAALERLNKRPISLLALQCLHF